MAVKRTLTLIVATWACLTGYVAALPEAATGRIETTAIAASVPQTVDASTPALLRSRLPDDLIGYIRIPELFRLLTLPKSDVGAPPAITAYEAVLVTLLDGVDTTLLPALPGDVKPLFEFVIARARSPIEVVMIDPGNSPMPLPNVMLSTRTDIESPDDANRLLSELVESQPMLELRQPVEADKDGLIAAFNLPVLVRLDAETRRLSLLSGPTVSPEMLDRILAGPPAAHAMHSLESKIDPSGNGLFLWLDPGFALRQLQGPAAQGPGQEMGLALDRMTGVAAGAGTREGKHHLKLLLEMPHAGLRRFVPLASPSIDFQSAGTLRTVAFATIPDMAYFEQLEPLIGMLASNGENPVAEWHEQVKPAIEAHIGFPLEQLVKAIGPEIITLYDDAGTYNAIRVSDRTTFDQLIDTLHNGKGWPLRSRVVDGREFHHLVVPSFEVPVEEVEDSATDDEKAWLGLLQRFMSLRTNLYWTWEGDYLLVADVPQPLIGRYRIANRTDLMTWLSREQRDAVDGSLLHVSTRYSALGLDFYQLDLALLQWVGDFLEKPIDMFSLPLAAEAGIRTDGGSGLRLVSDEHVLGLELNFEHNPLELLGGSNGMATIAVAGILAAIAIPAYNDYADEARTARTGEAISASAPLRDMIVETYRASGELPTPEVLQPLSEQLGASIGADVDYDPNDGSIYLAFDGIDGVLILVPRQSEEEIFWTCDGDLDPAFLPDECKE